MAAPLTIGATYRIAYRATLYAKRPTVKTLTLTTTLYPTVPKKVTYIFHGPKGGKVVLGPGEIITAERL